MLPGELKPILTTLVLPPAGPILLLAFGALMAMLRWRSLAWSAAIIATASLWLLSCQGFAALMARTLLPTVPPATVQQIQQSKAQAIVILGGGVEPRAPEYGTAQPSAPTLIRLRYGARLARATGLPVAFAGGFGWGASSAQTVSEAEVAQATLREWGVAARWLDGSSRDTAENAQQMRAHLQKEGVTRIVLVTQAWHMPRSLAHFEHAGFTVVPASTDYILAEKGDLLSWLPGIGGLHDSRTVLREWLAMQLMR
ncbi:YdcF family protein [Variovorax sp. VNK109]|jgi:uncharacterized SAM-binding protein YcdF (DUF218 family)|uniref:YdcF family protein n=1 Tax=Variovorax sp. VNK109 TaxID=3400919 RepID=UPI003C073601